MSGATVVTVTAETWDLLREVRRGMRAENKRLRHMMGVADQAIRDQRQVIEEQHAELLRLRTELARAQVVIIDARELVGGLAS